MFKGQAHILGSDPQFYRVAQGEGFVRDRKTTPGEIQVCQMVLLVVACNGGLDERLRFFAMGKGQIEPGQNLINSARGHYSAFLQQYQVIRESRDFIW